MGKEKSKRLLAELSRELNAAGEVDPETRKLLQRMNENLDRGDHKSTLEKVKELEARFAANHPLVERVTRSLIDSLGKMGI